MNKNVEVSHLKGIYFTSLLLIENTLTIKQIKRSYSGEKDIF